MTSLPALDDPSGFHALYHRHHATVFRVALSVLHDQVLAEDVTQDVFLSLWKRPDRFDASRGDLASYLRLLARSRALDAWRTARCGSRAQERLLERERGERPADADVTSVIEHRETRAELTAAVGRLPESQREAVALAYWGELAASEVATRTSVPLGTAKSRLRLGLARLRSDLAGPVGRASGA